MFLSLGDAVFIIGSRMVEIEFIKNDEAGLFLFEDELSDLAVLCGNTFCEVDDKHAEIGAADGFFGADRRENLDGVIAFTTRPEAGGIDEGEIFASERVGEVYRVASGSCDFGDDCAFVLEDGVDEGGFSGVRLADDSQLDAGFFGDFHDLFGFDVEGLDEGIDFIDEFGEITAVFG